jgi:hypothetical protein
VSEQWVEAAVKAGVSRADIGRYTGDKNGMDVLKDGQPPRFTVTVIHRLQNDMRTVMKTVHCHPQIKEKVEYSASPLIPYLGEEAAWHLFGATAAMSCFHPVLYSTCLHCLRLRIYPTVRRRRS